MFPGPQKPYYFKNKTPDTSSYYRIGSTNRLADIPLIEEMKRSVNHQSYDETPLMNANPEAVNFRLASGFFKKVKTFAFDDLETLLLVARLGNQKFPTVAGILLFGEDRSIYFPDYRIQMGVFKGLTKSIIVNSKETTESPIEAIETIEQFFKKHLSQAFIIEKIQREERWDIPLVVLREAVLNPFLHADYSQTGSFIRVCIFDDRVEIENPGILPFGLTLEDLKRGISKIRNRVISRVFKELKIVETWGSGIRRMIDACENHNLPEPVFEEIGSHFRVTIFRHQKDPAFFDETNQKIMDLIKEHSKLSNKEIAGFLGLPSA